MECLVCGSFGAADEGHVNEICPKCQREGWEIGHNGVLDRVEPAEQPYEPNYEPYDDDILTEDDCPF